MNSLQTFKQPNGLWRAQPADIMAYPYICGHGKTEADALADAARKQREANTVNAGILTIVNPSIDGIGVTMWRAGYLAGGSQEVRIYRRPRSYLQPADKTWLVRIHARAGELIETRAFARRGYALRYLAGLFRVEAVELESAS